MNQKFEFRHNYIKQAMMEYILPVADIDDISQFTRLFLYLSGKIDGGRTYQVRVIVG